MKTDQRPNYHLYTRAFENAKWFLTDQKSGEVTEYNYSEMSSKVIDGYLSQNRRYKNVTIRYLHRASCLIYREGYVEGVSYSKILPNYTIDCYDWHYQCRHCEMPLSQIREKGQKRVNKLFCPHCFKDSEYK